MSTPPLPDPFPEYLTCPHCGEPEVEVWCYQEKARCHSCGQWIIRERSSCAEMKPDCPWKGKPPAAKE